MTRLMWLLLPLAICALSGCGSFRSELPIQAAPLAEMDISRERLPLPKDEEERLKLPPGVFTGIEVGDSRQTLEAQIEAPEGVLVARVVENSPAVAAGIAEGDILLKAGVGNSAPTSLHWPSDWYKLEETTPPDAKIHVFFDRAGRDGEADIKPVQRLAPPRRLEAATFREEAKVGVVVRNASEVEAHKAGLVRGEGCVVVGLAASSPWRKAGMVFGDIITDLNGAPIANPQALLTEINHLNQGDDVRIGVFRDDRKVALDTSVSRRKKETTEFDFPLIFSYKNHEGIENTSVLLGLYSHRKTAVASRVTLFWIIDYTVGDATRLEETK
jgi:C-terminal processing protease CtpA/Prc